MNFIRSRSAGVGGDALLCLPCWLMPVPTLPGLVLQEWRRREEALCFENSPTCLFEAHVLCLTSNQSFSGDSEQRHLPLLSFLLLPRFPSLHLHSLSSTFSHAQGWSAGTHFDGHPLVHRNHPARPVGTQRAPSEGSGAGGDPLLSSWLAGTASCSLHPHPAGWFNSSSLGFGVFFIKIESLCTKSVHHMDNLFWEEVIVLLTRSSQLYLKPESAEARVTHGCLKPQREALFL